MKNTLIITFLLLGAQFTAAQDSLFTNPDSVAEMPEGVLVSEDELMADHTNRTNLSVKGGTTPTLSYNDSVLLHRLSRIPTTIDLPLNDVTRQYIDTYSTRMKGSVAIMLGASNFYNPIIEEALERYGLPYELKYLAVIESALRPSATSRTGAAGLWQFMPATGQRYGLVVNTLVDERRDPIKSTDAAARYLRDLYGEFGDWSLAIAAYNCGENNVRKAIVREGNPESPDFWAIYNQLPRETRGYVPAFVAATYIMNYYCEHGIVPLDASLPLESDTVMVRHEVTFPQIAAQCGVSVDELRAVNPQYRRDIVPVDHALRLPESAVGAFLTMEDSIRTSQPVQSSVPVVQTPARASQPVATKKYVTVKNGDSLSIIAKRNGITVAKLRSLNNLKGNMIHPNQRLRVK